jgi:drug/metabolite transporter (DMT)-like permease
LLPPVTVLAGVMAVGLVVTLPAVVWAGPPARVRGVDVMWLAITGAANVAGLVCFYAGVRVGKVAVVGALASTEGAFAGLLAVATGEQLSLATASVLALVVAGIVITASGARGDPQTPIPAHQRTAVMCGVGAATLFGASLFAAGRAAAELPAVWVALPARAVGTVAVALPLLARGRLRIPLDALPFVAGAGLAEVTGSLAFALGARHGIAVTAVLGSEFAALAAVAAFVLLHERLTRRQLVGVTTIAMAVACLSAVRA